MGMTYIARHGTEITAAEKRLLDTIAKETGDTYADWSDIDLSPVAADAVEQYIKRTRPVVLTTIEELEELPRHTIISYGTLYIYVRLTSGWYFGGADSRPHTSEELVNDGRGPFTVIMRGPE